MVNRQHVIMASPLEIKLKSRMMKTGIALDLGPKAFDLRS